MTPAGGNSAGAAWADAGEASLGTCPSAPAESASAVLGAVMDSGTVAYISPKIPISRELLDGLRANGVPVENRVRFLGPCLGGKCAQWTGHRCGLADAIVNQPAVLSPPEEGLPKCGIRSTCRWYAQHASAACMQCPVVIYEPHAE
ncbi:MULTISPECIES: hypothetical protein [Burkholderia]|uniref:Nitrogen fixation protein n=1 Tax=Burkholderia mayonis TaxID=1385591 RepID=A0A1B4FP26_9BURK|nr:MULTISPECIES: hypothetical protein [Burkholderia]AOJ05432.1 hypothetical protein WS70_27490 [Burkholderia mayonis]KVE38041.1 hypothetical protein WS69_09565 [Burkholderia sp. BDU5]KVE47855.1 hypothetical protein WS70_25270 [Burkholderia mayonis]